MTKSFLKHLTGKDLYISDLEDLDPEQSKHLHWVLENSVEGYLLTYILIIIITGKKFNYFLKYYMYYRLDLEFCLNRERFGEVVTIELVENGENKLVTDENKKDYVKLIVNYIMTEQIKDQI